MGLSASQTRFLTLTARKSNVEFQGQQINQARTALANQSAELFTQMMDLKAPTAPSVYNYVINPATNPNINWAQENVYPLDKGAQKNFMLYYASNKPQFKDFNIPEYKTTTAQNGDTIYSLKGTDKDGKTTWTSQYASRTVNNETEWYSISTDDKGETQYTKLTECPLGTYAISKEGKFANGKSISYLDIVEAADANYYYDAQANKFQPVQGVVEADLPQWIKAYNLASTQFNKYSEPNTVAIYEPGQTNINSDTVPASYERSASTAPADAEYKQALAQYEIDLQEYNEAMEIINAKTDEIHEADKKLELQLKQLDTEQEAIQTEYESVKKVIEKNIENTFKTFA